MKSKIPRLYRVLIFGLLFTVNISVAAANWGYGYNDLLNDLVSWNASPWVTVDSIGASVQNRALWELTITDTTPPSVPRHTVYIHTRTHPNEFQSFRVTEQIIAQLIADDPFARLLRRQCTFYIIPMYNPDGVELGYDRQNANGIDIESNWADVPLQPEPAALKKRFEELMSSDAPIEIALNMHSAYAATQRYFVFHHANGTSAVYAQMEQAFIAAVQGYFPSGIASWDHTVTWTSITPDYYPESWFWLNHGAAVLALTYEDMNNAAAGMYDSSANAILHGIGDYLGLEETGGVVATTLLPELFSLRQNYPNPFNPSTRIDYELKMTGHITMRIYDLLGRPVAMLVDVVQGPGLKSVIWYAGDQPAGVYICRLSSGRYGATCKMTIIK
ncbi:MAG: M14 family zinc carboxypeptidase [Candidatus Neomarinimicrobiota bacterium]